MTQLRSRSLPLAALRTLNACTGYNGSYPRG
jgi:hypothetical protein